MSFKGLPLTLPIVEHRMSEALHAMLMGSGKQIEGDFYTVKEDLLSSCMLLVDQGSPLRVLMRPRLRSGHRREIRDCCDKSCEGCRLPLRDPTATGWFVQKRLKKLVSKRKWAPVFSSPDYREALEHAQIHPLTIPLGLASEMYAFISWRHLLAETISQAEEVEEHAET